LEGTVADGPLEYVVIGFQGNPLNGEIGAAIREAVEKGLIRVVDLMFARRELDGSLVVLEWEDIGPESAAVYGPVAADVTAMLSEDDVRELSEALEPDTSAAILLFEHTWAIGIRDALVRANGRLIEGGIIPREVVNQVTKVAAA